jgi:hypothetical protein
MNGKFLKGKGPRKEMSHEVPNLFDLSAALSQSQIYVGIPMGI